MGGLYAVCIEPIVRIFKIYIRYMSKKIFQKYFGRDWHRNRFARDEQKAGGPSWGKQLLGERPRETAET
jgi:hypothetical protein